MFWQRKCFHAINLDDVFGYCMRICSARAVNIRVKKHQQVISARSDTYTSTTSEMATFLADSKPGHRRSRETRTCRQRGNLEPGREERQRSRSPQSKRLATTTR